MVPAGVGGGVREPAGTSLGIIVSLEAWCLRGPPPSPGGDLSETLTKPLPLFGNSFSVSKVRNRKSL